MPFIGVLNPGTRRFVYEETRPDGWTEWQWPVQGRGKVYKLTCCDCALTHDFQFRVKNNEAQFRVRSNKRATAQKRRRMEEAKRQK
jgi:hypothetical protein